MAQNAARRISAIIVDHAKILGVIGMNVSNDTLILEPTFDPGFETQITDKFCYDDDYTPECGIFPEQLNIRSSLPLLGYCVVLYRLK